ncbi:hypothetical protein CDL15_Pgr007243 [Punica granatum]|uniref:Bulb-type lectin domain-containing protein n=1 Tax=Punica granatum TaxID=22663 RepID=A0A218XA19_PUNGR|nr:hypothetical protein CDL15_Pgr007243 [Punica granatum]
MANIYAPCICIRLPLWACFLIQLCNFAAASASTDTIIEGQRLGHSQTLTSSGQVFELQFFFLQNSTNSYLGIWYKKIEPRTFVWVGNRVQPLKGSSPYLTLKQGNLVIIDDRITYSVSDLSSAQNTRLTLLD